MRLNLNILSNKIVPETLLSQRGLEKAAGGALEINYRRNMGGNSPSRVWVRIHQGREFSNGTDTPLGHAAVATNEARLRGASARSAWSQGTIDVGRQGVIQSDRQSDPNPAPIMPAEPESICVVDDDASVRNSIEQLLDSEGLKAQSFEDAEEFLAYARSHVVPLAVLDIWMQKMSGLEVQKRLQVVSPNTRVIVMTAREIPAIRAVALEGGALAFLVKPFDDEAFLSLVRQALRPAT